MTRNDSNVRRAKSRHRVSRRLSREQRRQQILKVAAGQFAATGFRSTTTGALAKAAGISEAMLYIHFGTKRKLFEEVVERNIQDRLAGLRERFFLIPDMPPLETVESMAESTILACVDHIGNASVVAWGLMEIPEFAADVYRAEIGAAEALWATEIGTRFGDSPVRTPLSVHLVPYVVHTCMAFGFWLASLRHRPETAQAHARQYAEAIVHVARAVLNFVPEPLQTAASRQTGTTQICAVK